MGRAASDPHSSRRRWIHETQGPFNSAGGGSSLPLPAAVCGGEGEHSMHKLTSAAALALLAFAARPAGAARDHGPQLSSARDQAAALQNESVGGPFTAVCDSSTSFRSNIMANCDSTVLPHNETSIAADPANPAHLVGSSNDTELPPSGTSGTAKSVLGFYTSFDGGRSWLNGQVPAGKFTQSDDPTVGFDTRGNVFIGGGASFSAPVIVEQSTSATIFEDKPYLAVDTNARSLFRDSVYMTWARFHFDRNGNYLESPIFFSVSRDAGQTWSTPVELSGANPSLCTFSGTPLPYDGRCREDQFASPVVAPDGTLFVAFENDQAVNDGEFRDQYLVVKSTDGGATFSAPVRASDLLRDGVDDYPINVQGRQTLSSSQFRVNSAGNLAVDPVTGALSVVWSDNRDGTAASTNTGVFLARSADGGATWSGPVRVSTARNDQFFPWAAVGPDGTVNVMFMDRSYDPANSRYGITLARAGAGGAFRGQRVDTGLSDPNHARWFSAATGGETTFLGDYNGLSVGTDGVAHPLWTDMRRVVTAGGATGTTEDIFSAAVP